jgi:signal transduction histidine kinase
MDAWGHEQVERRRIARELRDRIAQIECALELETEQLTLVEITVLEQEEKAIWNLLNTVYKGS